MKAGYQQIKEALKKSNRIVLFLDYDGTLADFKKHPDILEPDSEVEKLLRALIKCEKITPAIVSGRRLAHLQRLIPIPDLIIAGTYGLEIQHSDGSVDYRLDYDQIRPSLEELKPVWQSLIAGQGPFFLEDKGWALAIHARHVDEAPAGDILTQAEDSAENMLDSSRFQILSGDKFLEASPTLADKGHCVKYLMGVIPTDEAAVLYLGDDDKDEQAFSVVHHFGGFAIRVCSNIINQPIEDWRLANPAAARAWLWTLAEDCP